MNDDGPATGDLTAADASWPSARTTAHAAAEPVPPATLPLAEALGGTLATDVVALVDLPPFDTVSMDGWAVAGPAPWRVVGRQPAGDRPGQVSPGEALEVGTGSAWPVGAERVLRRERGTLRDDEGTWLQPDADDPFPARLDVRRAGEEARRGDMLLAAGHVVTPPVLGLVAAVGHDALTVRPQPRVGVAVLGDELLSAGLPGDGRVRDALSPQLPGWVAGAGGRLAGLRRVPDTLADTRAALAQPDVDLVVTTGGTAHGPVDQLHAALSALGAELLVDGVAVRPGHPMLLARLPQGPVVVGLPGNPLAAAVGFVGLAVPALLGARGLPLPLPLHLRLAQDVTAPPASHRVVPAVLDASAGVVTLLPHTGPAMLRGLARATHLAVAPPGGAAQGDLVDVLPVPWGTA